MTKKTSRMLDALSPRERDVAELLAEGLELSEIAQELGIKTPTVKAHLSSILTALDARNRVEVALVVWKAKRETDQIWSDKVRAELRAAQTELKALTFYLARAVELIERIETL